MKNKIGKTKLVAVDLFCGVGGLTHGLMRGGVRVGAGVDIDPACKFPFEENNSSKFVQSDVGNIAPDELNELFDGAEIRLLAGCAPCQPFSTYSRSGRNKEYEKQWPLVRQFGRLVKALKPELVTMENVPQLLDHAVFEEFLKNFKGYSTWWSVVECAEFGVPQTRKRLVFLASRFGPEKLEIKKTHLRPVSVKSVIGKLPPLEAGESDHRDALHVAASLSPLNLQRIRASRPGGTWRDWPEKLQAECHKKASGMTYPSVYGRMDWTKPAPTMTTQCFGYGNGRFGHPAQDRAISLREAAMLQTFPRSYKFVERGAGISFSKLGRLIGNAVPVRLGEVIGKSLIEHVARYETGASVA